jgi:hypothetical protein
MSARFKVGHLVATPKELASLLPDDIMAALGRHVQGDWGDVDEHDRKENELSLIQGLRLFSIYHSPAGVKFWITTEADRSRTTVLLLEDY